LANTSYTILAEIGIGWLVSVLQLNRARISLFCWPKWKGFA